MIIGGSASQDLAAHVAKELGEELGYVEIKKFPDGEKYLRVDGVIKDEVTKISPFSSSAKATISLISSPQSEPKKAIGRRFVAQSCALKLSKLIVGISRRLIL